MTDVLHRPGKPVGAIIGAARVIRALHQSPKPMNASQVARATGLYRGTAYNILRTLQAEDIVSHEPEDKTYWVSLRTLEIAYGALRKSGLMDLARPLMHAVSEAHPVTVYVVQVIDNRTLLLVDWVGAAFRTDFYVSVGRRYPTASGAPGVIVAAFLPNDREDLVLRFERYIWFRKPTFNEFSARVEAARRDGFAIDQGDMFKGLTQICVPIMSEAQELKMLLLTVGYTHEIDETRQVMITRDLLSAASRMSEGLNSVRLT